MKSHETHNKEHYWILVGIIKYYLCSTASAVTSSYVCFIANLCIFSGNIFDVAGYYVVLEMSVWIIRGAVGSYYFFKNIINANILNLFLTYFNLICISHFIFSVGIRKMWIATNKRAGRETLIKDLIIDKFETTLNSICTIPKK